MQYKRMVVVLLALMLATLACSLSAGDEGQSAASAPIPTTFELSSVTSQVKTPLPTQSTAAVTNTVQDAAKPSNGGVALDSANSANSAANNTSNTSNTNTAAAEAAAQSSALSVESFAAAQSQTSAVQFSGPVLIPNCAPRADWSLYMVVSGDTLAAIARRTGTTWPILAQANCLANPGLIYVGQALRVPGVPNGNNGNNGNVPVIAYPGYPPADQCNVVVLNGNVAVYAGPYAGANVVASLYNYAPYMETAGDYYRIPLPWGGYGWVGRYVTELTGFCQQNLPVFTNPGSPSPFACSAIRPANSLVYVYPLPQGWQEPIGVLGNFAPVVQQYAGRYELALQGWGVQGWVYEHEVQLFGDCGFLNPQTPIPPSPTYTPAPPPPNTPIPGPYPNLPRVSNPGLPPQDRCSVVVKNNVPAVVYAGPIGIVGPIAVLTNYAPYVNSIDGGYTIAIGGGREGWVSETDTYLEGQCVVIFGEDAAQTGAE